jgi:preprotein translocase subunit Sec61beta
MLVYDLESVMAKRESGGSGLMSSAGLMRYFEAEESAIKLDPKTVVIASVALGVVVFVLNVTVAHAF